MRALLSILLAASACAFEPGELDRPRSDGGASAFPDGSMEVPQDAGDQLADGGIDDTGTALSLDASAPSCDACPSGTTCFRDVCLDTCGSRTLPFTDADLAPELRPLWNTCPRLAAGVTAAIGNRLVHATASTRQRTTSITVSTLPVRPTATPGPALTCGLTFEADRDGVRVELYPQLALSPRGGWAHLAVTALGPSPNFDRLPGRSYLIELGTCAVTERPVREFGGAALFSEGPDELLLLRSLSAVELPSVFRGELEVANAQVWLTRYQREHALVSLYTGHGAHALSAIPIASLRSGPYPVMGGDADLSAWPFPREVLPGGDLVGRTRGGDPAGPHQRYAINGASLAFISFTPPVFFAAGVFTNVAPVEGTSQVALVHGSGVLVVE